MPGHPPGRPVKCLAKEFSVAVTSSSEAIAIVGTACRLPGGINGPDDLWSALVEGREAISEVPADRFDAARWLDQNRARAGKSYSAAGGFLDDIRGFDAGYFGLSPDDADRMDPQHRLVLELAVEALDAAGITGESLAGTDTAVYVGTSSQAFAFLQGLQGRSADAHTAAGGAACAVAVRLARFLDLRGPSAVIDTAGSSSLVALHHACEALRTGRCGTALAAGVHVLLSPFEYVSLAKASVLSPTGHCRPLSAAADGYVRAEGGGLVVLKPLRAALADGDPVHAVILGTGVNTDGRAPGPERTGPDAQEALLRQVHTAAGVGPDEMAYLEMGAMGAPAADQAECRAVGRALGTPRTAGHDLTVGSVTSHLGHLEPASGMAGLMKALLVLRHRQVPADLHTGPLNPDIDFARWRLAPATAPRPLGVPPGSRAVVGVNSFGPGGTNAHVVLADQATAAPTTASPRTATQAARPAVSESAPLPVVVSARTPAAAVTAAHRMADRLERCGAEEFYDLAYTAYRRRGRHEYRAAVLAADPAEAARRLRDLAARGPGAQDTWVAGARRGSVVFAFPSALGAPGAWGGGATAARAGADLLASEPVFRAGVNEADEALRPLLGWSVRDELAAPAGRRRPHTAEVAQPLLFAVQVGLVGAVRTYGLRPAAVVGHGCGEAAAAWAAGVLDLAAAARVVVEQSRAQAATVGDWGMAALGASAARVRQLLAPYADRVDVAAVDGDQDVTVSGDKSALTLLAQDCARAGVAFRDLGLDHAFHSHAMDGQQDALRTALADIKPVPARIPYASATTGTVLTGPELDAGYWWQNLREAVRFTTAVAALCDLGCDMFFDVGPDSGRGGQLPRPGREAPRWVAAPALQPDATGPEALRTAVARLLAGGAQADPDVFFPRPGRVVDLPAYPWQRTSHWNGSPAAWAGGCGDGTVDHPLLGERAAVAEPTWHGPFEPARLPWLADHQVDGSAVLPAAGYIEMMLSAGHRVFDTPVEITGLSLPHPLHLPYGDGDRKGTADGDGAASLELQTTLASDDGVTVVASREAVPGRADGTAGTAQVWGPWRQHARGRVRRLTADVPGSYDIPQLMAQLPEVRTGEEHYRRGARRGLRCGPVFQVLRKLRVGDGQVLARFRTVTDTAGYQAHPALLDGALQAVAPLLEDITADGVPFLPVSVARVRAWRRMPAVGHVHVHTRAVSAYEVLWDVTVLAPGGLVCLILEGCRARRCTPAHRVTARQYTTVLRAAPRPGQHFGPAPLPAPAEVQRECAAGAAPGGHAERRQGAACGGYDAAEGCAALVRQARELVAHFGAAAVRTVLGEGAERDFTIADLVTAGVAAAYEPLVRLFLRAAYAHGLVAPVLGPGTPGSAGAPGTQAWRAVAAAVPHERFRAIAAQTPGLAMELALTGSCGTHLADVLRGVCDPRELLFSEANRQLLEEWHTEGRGHGCAHRTIRAALAVSLARWPAERPLRVLEIGAGTGGTTACVLNMLPATRTQYLYTDASADFFPRAQRRFAAYDFVGYQVFDPDRDPAGQGLAEGGFDLVIAHDALHALSDLRRGLGHLAWLLAEGGQLLTAQAHDPALFALTSGLLPGFWSNEDAALRPDGPLLTADGWLRLLSDAGWDTPVVLAGGTGRAGGTGVADDAGGTGGAGGTDGTGEAEAGADAGCVRSVLLARRPGHPAPGPTPDLAPGLASGLAPDRAAGVRPGGDRSGRPRSWIIAAEPSRARLAFGLEEQLTAAGHAVRSTVLVTDPDHWSTLLAARPGPVGVALLLGGAPAAADDAPDATGSGGLAGGGTGRRTPRHMASGPATGQDGRSMARGVRTTARGAGTAEAKGRTTGQRSRTGQAADDRPSALDRAVSHATVLRSLAVAAGARTGAHGLDLWLVTPPTGVLPVPERPLAATAAAAWGMARCLGNELPGCTVRRVSLDTAGNVETDAARLLAEFTDPGAENELLLTPTGRFVTRVREGREPAAQEEPETPAAITPAATTSEPVDTASVPPAGHGTPVAEVPVRTLRLRTPGPAYDLAWVPGGMPRPGPDDVVIRVHAAGLDHGDLLRARGTLSLDDRSDRGLGRECAGVVTQAGAGVTRFAPGDRVFGFGSGTLGSHAVLPAALVGRIPDGMGFCAAATLPVVFLTVQHALGDLARLAPGETVLVDGGAGGVGLAALQYARQAGARIVAAVSSAVARDLLRLLGVRHVLDSDRPGCADRIRALTGGRGVDVVLSSRAGDAAGRGLAVLAPGGRLIAVGPHDPFDSDRRMTAPFPSNRTYATADLERLAHDRPQAVAAAFEEVVRRVRDGVYRPVLHHVCPAERVMDAFAFLVDDGLAGKVVVGLEELPRPAHQPVRYRLEPQASYLVTGGLSGFGAATARWLADRGARHLHLVGRRGCAGPGAPELVAELRGQGAEVTVHTADVTDPEAMKQVLTVADSWANPLRGVVHAAAVSEDRPVTHLTDEAVRRMLAPKTVGAEVLDGLTRSCHLDFFVLYSSAAALLGTPQRAGLAAAGLSLEALARTRRRAGRPALAVAWGALYDDAATPHRTAPANGADGARFVPVPALRAFAALDELLGRGDEVAAVVGTERG